MAAFASLCSAEHDLFANKTIVARDPFVQHGGFMKRHREGPTDDGLSGEVAAGSPGKRTRSGSLAGAQDLPSPAMPVGSESAPYAATPYDDPFALHLPPTAGGAAGAPGGSAPPSSASEEQISVERRIRALLHERIGARDTKRQQARKQALLHIFAAIPENERGPLLERAKDPSDELGWLLANELSPQLRRALLAALRGEASPSPQVFDSEDVTAFAATLGGARFGTSENIVSIDPQWSPTRAVDMFVRPGAPPPVGDAGTVVHWRLVDRRGNPVQRGSQTWGPGEPACSPWTVDVTEPGQWQVAVEVVHDGLVIATSEIPILVRVAAPTGAELVTSIKNSDPRVVAANMSDAELVSQTEAVREQLGAYALGKKGPDDARDITMLRSALQELEWQGSQRLVDGKPVVSPGGPGALSLEDAKSGESADAGDRALIQRRIDALIAKRGLTGAGLTVAEMERDLADEGEGALGGVVNEALGKRVAIPWLREEIAARRAEALQFLERFDEAGRAITYALLAESEARVRNELERYQLNEAQAGGGYAGQGLKAGADASELRGAVEHGRRIQTAHAAWMQADRARTRDGAGDEKADAARRLFETTREVALAKHPMLRPFLEGTTQQARVMPSGSVPGILDVGNYPPEHLAKFMGWELNQKLSDIDETRTNIGDGTLSIFGVPKVVALTRQEMRVPPGTMLDGAVNERVAQADSSRGWTQGLIAAISFSLGLMLAVPTGGASVPATGIVAAGEMALLASDLYLLGKDYEERGIYRAAANTDTTSVHSLLQEEPSAGPLIFGFLGFAGPVAGVGSIVRTSGDMAQAMARAREGVTAVRDVRLAASAASGDLTQPAVVQRVERLRGLGREAGMADDEIDALVRTVSRNAPDSAASDDAAKATGRGGVAPPSSITADPVELQLRSRMSGLGIDSHASDELLQLVAELKLPFSSVLKIHDDALRAASAPEMLQELRATMALQRAGRVQGLGEWVGDVLPKLKQNANSFSAELRDARRLVAEHPGALVVVGRDSASVAPVDPTTGEKLRSFDSEVRAPSGAVERSVELEVVGEILNPSDIDRGVTHAARKARERAAAGAPVSGDLEAAVGIKLKAQGPKKKSGTVTHDDVGNRLLHTRDGQVIDQGNFFDKLAGHIPSIPDSNRLSRVTLVDMDTGIVVAQYDRNDGVWSRKR